MKPAELPGRLNRLQRSLRFKVVASVVLVVLAAGLYGAWLVALNAPGAADVVPPPVVQPQPGADAAATDPALQAAPRLDPEALRQVLGSRSSALGVGLGVLVATGLALAVVWLGVGLTYLGLLLLGAAVAAPLIFFEPTRSWGRLLAGAIALTMSFTALMQAVRMALSGSSPVIAIARNVLSEAVRMKISVVFIVLLILLLAALPGLLNEDQPLRYRVQSFLQYGVSGTFWTLAMMTLFFSAGSVAFEQRDRIIWQTMAKPVRPYEYLAGKWLGVMALNAVLLSVAASGVFLFTEYLRTQPAQGEEAPFVNMDGTGAPTVDRLLLHSQVLVARTGVEPDIPETPQEEIMEAVRRRVEDARSRDPEMLQQPGRLDQVTREVFAEQYDQWRTQLRTIAPGRSKKFVFSGLDRAKREGRPLTLIYKINSGGDDPTQLYRVTFILSGAEFQENVALNTTHRLPFRPEAIDDQGRVEVEVFNGDIFTGQLNRATMRFPPGEFEILYAQGGYEANFLRVMFILWVKLGFVAAVAMAGATFLSFPVACLLALVVLFAGESAAFLSTSLEQYDWKTAEGKIDWVSVIMRSVAYPVAWAFQTYSQLRPTTNLVDGRLVGWGGVARALVVLGVWTLGVLTTGWLVFRRRELAVYSGH